MSLLTTFCQNTTTLSRINIRKLSSNHSAGIKLNMRKQKTYYLKHNVKLRLLPKIC